MIDVPPPVPSAQVEIFTTGYSKGLAQTDGIQIVGRGAVELGSFSLEGLAKNLESSGDKGAEVSAAVGYTREVAGIEMAARALVKHQPGIDTPGFDSTALELKADFAGDVGPAKATLGFTYSPDDTGSTEQSLFSEAGVSIGIAKGVKLGGKIGRRDRGNGPDYYAYNAGISYDPIKNVTIDGRVYDTDRSNLGYAYKRRAVASIRVKF
ncbi:TorF family putative porin [Sphingomonas sp. LY29]|uniref:TorF family putative porin n=1 Tax=Sphingomonas sp. LY29 TaxID=3095341 RepID=UPI002D77EEAF|nr:TorF family putative porin [Sphingomonas sp. LY29]WRP26514.1 TorF family putative porin [Sphingomonas sp. LY29]